MIFRSRYFVVVAMSLLLAACGSSPSSPLVQEGSGSVVGDGDYLSREVTHSIAGLKGLYLDDSHAIGEVVVIAGVITANNVAGEFPDTLILEDDSGAIEVSVEVDELRVDCKIGYTITINCTDLWLGSRGGTLLLGVEPTTNDDAVDVIDEESFEQRISITESGRSLQPTTTTIAQFDSSMISRFIRLDGVSFVAVDGVTQFCLRDEDSGLLRSTSHTLIDADGDCVELFVVRTASYAAEALPSGEGSVGAILDYFAGEYSLRIVNSLYLF